jgi:hypothetical protein
LDDDSDDDDSDNDDSDDDGSEDDEDDEDDDDEDNEDDSFFLEDRRKRRVAKVTEIGKLGKFRICLNVIAVQPNVRHVFRSLCSVIWNDRTIDQEVENIASFVAENTGAIGKLTKGVGGAAFLRKFSEVTTGTANKVIPGVDIYFHHLLFARKARDQASDSGNSIVKSAKIGARFLRNWVDVIRSQT